MSKRGRTLTKPTKFSPSKEIFEAAARRRLQAEQDTEEEQQQTDTKRVRAVQSTGSKAGPGPLPKKAKGAPRKILETSATESEEEDDEVDETVDEDIEEDQEEVEEESEKKKAPVAAKGRTGKKATARATKKVNSKKSRRRVQDELHTDESEGSPDNRVGFHGGRNVSPARGGTVDLTQIAAQFDSMDKLRAIIRGKDSAATVPPPSRPEKPEEKLSMRDMFTLLTDFAKAVREPVAAPASAPAIAPAIVPAPAPPAPAPPVAAPPAPAPVAASPLTLENFVMLMKAFQANIK